MVSEYKKFVDRLESIGLKRDDVFVFMWYGDNVITYRCKMSPDCEIELNMTTTKQCYPIETIQELFYDFILDIQYVSCMVYEKGKPTTCFRFARNLRPMFHEYD
jgi:hypothetical protein